KNLAQSRGDRRGAFRLAVFLGIVQMCLWLARAHFTASFGTFGIFIIAMCTSVFYAVVIWTLYLGLEPYARRRWQRIMSSWSSILTGRWRDPVVGRDALIGFALGASILLLDRLKGLWLGHLGASTPELDSLISLQGPRAALSVIFTTLPHGIRDTV